MADRKKHGAPDGWAEAFQFYMETLRPKGGEYPFTGPDGKLLKRLIRMYGLSKTKAIIQLYKEDCSWWVRQNVGLGWKGLQMELAKLMDNPRLKDVERKFDGEVSAQTVDLLNKIQIKPITEPNESKRRDGSTDGLRSEQQGPDEEVHARP